MWIRIQADYNMQTTKQNKSFANRENIRLWHTIFL